MYFRRLCGLAIPGIKWKLYIELVPTTFDTSYIMQAFGETHPPRSVKITRRTQEYRYSRNSVKGNGTDTVQSCSSQPARLTWSFQFECLTSLLYKLYHTKSKYFTSPVEEVSECLFNTCSYESLFSPHCIVNTELIQWTPYKFIV